MTDAKELSRCERQAEDWMGAMVALATIGQSIRFITTDFVCSLEIDPAAICAAKMEDLAAMLGVPYVNTLDSDTADGSPLTWRRLQLAEVEHRSLCGPPLDEASLELRLRHYAIKLTILTARLGLSFDKLSPSWEEMLEPTLAELLMLGVTLASDIHQDLPEYPIPTTHDELEAAFRDDGFA